MSLRIIFISAAFGILLIYGVLLVSVFYYMDAGQLLAYLTDKRIVSAVKISMAAASLAALLAVLLAIPAAYALSRYRFPLKNTIDVMLEFPMIISPSALGALILIFFQTPAGSFLRDHVLDVVYAFSGIVVAQFIAVLGICTRMMKAVFDEIPLRYEKMARTLGATHSLSFFRVTLPLSGNGLLSAVMITWAKAIGEFGATITVAGSMAMKTETLPTAIFMKLSAADVKGTIVLILILLTISILILLTTRLIIRKKFND